MFKSAKAVFQIALMDIISEYLDIAGDTGGRIIWNNAWRPPVHQGVRFGSCIDFFPFSAAIL
tara:strand:- start:243 stop:428 length:186 start_codon:yes stop_codon:yes gene_type:complete